ncbi:DUF2934 domain-containing protein [Microvirga pakistanensis]|uniref:DUF2934 domain-containing protein n=1 Tax=Microvirga pakistanensis TaxID=1682650 RepID=UPI001FCEB574|nr:DUF2934 domain-containing protein [Microvirga pakistanensis]
MNDWEEKVRVRAYQIWERQGRTGNPFDHWHEAEEELRAEEAGPSQERPEATVEEATPAEAVEAAQTAAAGKGSSES